MAGAVGAMTGLRAGAVIYVRDVAAMTAFYAGVAGLAVVHSEDAYAALGSAGYELVLLRAPEEVEEATAPVRRRTETPIKLVFVVGSIAVARAAAVGLGGEVNGREQEWTYEGARVCDGQDPEGNVFQLRGPR